MTDIRERIIHASLYLFEREGFHGATVKQIVEKADTSKGGFYHHFASKDELLFVIHDTFITHALDKAIIANTTHQLPPQKLSAIIREFVKVFDLYKPHIAVFYRENIYLKHEYEVMVKTKRDQFKQIIFEAIREGIKNGSFRQDLSAEITGMAILGMVNWTYMWYKPSGDKTIDEIADIFVDLILHAVTMNE